MVSAALWGGLASISLLIGALMGIYLKIPKIYIAFIMAFGTGILIGAATFDLLLHALHESGIVLAGISFLIGALVFTIVEVMLNKKGGSDRKRSKKNPTGHSGMAIYAGTLLDAIPESIIIGVSLLSNSHVNWLFVVAIFISNLPESLSSSVGLKLDHYSNRKILGLWTSVVIVSSICSLIGYVFLKNASEQFLTSIGAFGAGALISMVCTTMLPEAFEESGPIVGFITSLGLIFSLFLTQI
ncbi:ZIP family zinc transporter [Bacillus pakistanensis]|uniref:ZIP family zinc transporter n=1 Tax=Rossellomorea pakistanensis TaxID=992288 RepID=A0ABS2N956_9BACI|nr:ZIP family metal transporter [Bacillus pakistanensis]MBM7584096.1 ZIP family zinc transporter [Bacillus pakistanensis]